MRHAYPSISPYHDFMLPVGSPHLLYVEECGNPDGQAVVFIHGGPGAGCSAEDRRFFDPKKYRIILFDQRGCGRSTPLVNAKDGMIQNRTEDLIADIDALRQYLAIDQWVVFGGSWGSTLSLLYAQSFPHTVQALILRGIFLSTSTELHHLFQDGMSRFFPQEFETFKSLIPPPQQHDLLGAYFDLIKNGSPDQASQAAIMFGQWEANGFTVIPPASMPAPTDRDIAAGIIECTYLAQHCFIDGDEILSHMDQLAHIPLYIAHGRFDTITTAQSANALFSSYQKHARTGKNSALKFTEQAAHSSREATTLSTLVEYTDLVAELLTS